METQKVRNAKRNEIRFLKNIMWVMQERKQFKVPDNPGIIDHMRSFIIKTQTFIVVPFISSCNLFSLKSRLRRQEK